MPMMEKREVIKLFLDNGYQLDVSALNFFYENQDLMKKFLTKLYSQPEKPSIITLDFVNKILGEVQTTITELKKFSVKKTSLTVSDFTKKFNKQFDEIRKLLIKRLELVNTISLNKISERTKKFSLIVMVRGVDKNTNSIVVEDQTGVSELKVSADKDLENIFPDEVIGLTCSKYGSDIFVEKIVWPDIPLRREVTKSKDDVDCLFISDIHMDSKNFNKLAFENFLDWLSKNQDVLLFVLGDVSAKEKDVKIFFESIPQNIKKVVIKGEVDFFDSNLIMNDPSFLNVHDVKIFLTHGILYENYITNLETTSANLFVNLLKARHLNPTFKFSKVIYEDDPFFLDIIPDIIVCGHFHKPEIINYKGVTIISNGSFITSPVFWKVNLKTRETIKIDFTQK